MSKKENNFYCHYLFWLDFYIREILPYPKGILFISAVKDIAFGKLPPSVDNRTELSFYLFLLTSLFLTIQFTLLDTATKKDRIKPCPFIYIRDTAIP